jgi:hypothetical protein
MKMQRYLLRFGKFLNTNLKDQKRHHVIISGTGRAGTTVIVTLLTKLGLDTGFKPDEIEHEIFPNCNAGLELDIRKPDAPYIIKSPWICEYIEELIHHKEIVIDYAIIPVRDMREAALSRIIVNLETTEEKYPNLPVIYGGLWGTKNPDEQEDVLYKNLFRLLLHLSSANIPLIFIHYPKLTKDPSYLFEKLRPILQKRNYRTFLKAYQETIDPNLVHNYGKGEDEPNNIQDHH